MQDVKKKRSLFERFMTYFITNDMTVGNPYKLMLKFSIPLIIGNIFQQLYNMVDSIVVGKYVGPSALAAVGTGFPFLMILSSLFIGVGMGAMVIISQYAGAKDYERLQMTVGTIYRSMLTVIVPFSLIGLLLARPVLIAMNVADDGTLDQAYAYLSIVFVGSIGSMGFNMNAGLLQGMGDSVTSLIFLFVATVLNIGLDLLFVLVFHLGTMGVALATVIAQFVSWIVGIFYINAKYPYLQINLFNLQYDSEILKRAVRIGIPSGAQNMLFALGALVIQTLVNKQGVTFMAGFTGATKIDAFVFLPIMSISTAISTYTGQNYGAKKMDRIQLGLRSGMALSVGTSVIVAALLYPFSRAAMYLFAQDPATIEAGVTYLHTLLPFYFLVAALFTISALMRGLGQTMVAMIITLVSMWLMRVPSAYLLTDLFGPQYMYYSYPIGWFVGLCYGILVYKKGRWRQELAKALEGNT